MIAARQPFQVTGRFVLVCIVSFFVVVAAVNAVMIRFAVTTFGGVETESSYKAGLAFKAETEASAAQTARGWTVEVRLAPGAAGTAITVSVRDSAGTPVTGADVEIGLAHPADRRRDVLLAASETAAGLFRAEAPAGLGRRTLGIELVRNGERQFRSVSKVLLP